MFQTEPVPDRTRISAYVSATLAQQAQQAADAEHMSLSTWVRRLVADAVEKVPAS